MDTVDLMDRVYQKLMALDTQKQQQVDKEILESYDNHPIVEYNIAMTEPVVERDNSAALAAIDEFYTHGKGLTDAEAAELQMGIDGHDKGTPHHYQLHNGQDLYDLFLKHYNRDIVLAHLELTCIEYLLRCRKKGQYVSDLHKVQVIMNRIGAILDSTVEGT